METRNATRPVRRSIAIPERWSSPLAFLFFALAACLLFAPALFGGKLPGGFDVIAVDLPFHAEIMRSLVVRRWPLWMPDTLGGMPGIASCNFLFLYPTDLFSCLAGLPFHLQLGLDDAVHLALAGTGTFLFLRRLRLGFSASLLGASFFAFSGSQATQVSGGFYNFVEGIALLPWAFWAAHKGREEGSRFAWGLCGLAFALQILAGAAQLFAYTLAAVAFFLPTVAPPRPAADASGGPGKGRSPGFPSALGWALALGTAFLLAAPQLWLTLQYLPFSARQGYTHAQFVAGSIDLSEALLWVVPGWHTPTLHGFTNNCTSEYFGLLPWTLASGALAALWRRDGRTRRLAFLAFGAFFLAQDRWTPFYALFHRLPVVAGFRDWSRTLFVLTFAVCVLAAQGWDALNSAEARRPALRGARLFLLLAAAAAALAWLRAPGQALENVRSAGLWPDAGAASRAAAGLNAVARNSAVLALELAAGLLALLAFCGKQRPLAPVLLAALAFQALDQGLLLRHFIKFMDPRAAVGSSPFRPSPPAVGMEPWRMDDSDTAHPNNAALLGYENLEGAESVPLRSYREIKDALKARPQAWADLMNERYAFSHSDPGGSLPGDRITLVENRDAFPRAWLVGKSVKVSGDAEAYALLADPAFHPRSEVAVPVDPGLAGSPPRGQVLWLERDPQAFTLAVSTDRAAALVLSDFWYPSWAARVDGRETPVLKADGGLQAVVLPPGGHRVELRFDPTLFYRALAACLAGLVFLVGLGCMEYGEAKKQYPR